MPTLHAAAEQLARDIIANDLIALMQAFTPQGMVKALAVQAQTGGAQDATSYVIEEQGENVVHITFHAPDGDGTIVTRWVQKGESWKVDDMRTGDSGTGAA